MWKFVEITENIIVSLFTCFGVFMTYLTYTRGHYGSTFWYGTLTAFGIWSIYQSITDYINKDE